MATVTDGMYRISLSHQSYLTGVGERRVMILSPHEAHELSGATAGQWEIRRTEGGDYTIRHADTGQYASPASDPPRVFEPILLSTQQRTWTIADRPEENTVTIGAPGTDLTLGRALWLTYPPEAALTPRQDVGGWLLEPEEPA